MKTLPKGHRSVFDPLFRYKPAAETDLAKTFARIRRERAAVARDAAELERVVRPLQTFKGKA